MKPNTYLELECYADRRKKILYSPDDCFEYDEIRGAYVYDVRGCAGVPEYIEKKAVHENFDGQVLSLEELDFGDKDFIMFNNYYYPGNRMIGVDTFIKENRGKTNG